jgi:hypothetical protein
MWSFAGHGQAEQRRASSFPSTSLISSREDLKSMSPNVSLNHNSGPIRLPSLTSKKFNDIERDNLIIAKVPEDESQITS